MDAAQICPNCLNPEVNASRDHVKTCLGKWDPKTKGVKPPYLGQDKNPPGKYGCMKSVWVCETHASNVDNIVFKRG